MRLQKEEKIALVLLLMAFGDVTVATWMLEGEGDGYANVEGVVLGVVETKTGGHIIVQIESCDPIFVPSYAGAAEIAGKVRPGDFVVARGEVGEFSGRREIKIMDPGDFEVKPRPTGGP